MVTEAAARLRALAPFLVALGVAAVIRPTLMPSVGLWDTAEFQTVPPILGTMHPTGYPTYVLLGWVVNLVLTPFGPPAYRMNLLSLVCVAVAAGLLVRTVERLTGRTWIGVAAGIGLALTPIVWRIGTQADAHALHLAFVALLVLLLVRWEEARGEASDHADRWLIAAAGTFGLAAGNHSLTLLLAVPIALFVLAVDPRIVLRPRLVATCAAVLAGALVLVYLELPLRAGPFRAPLVYGAPDTWSGFWYIALAEQFRGSLHDPFGNLGPKLIDLATLGDGQLGWLAPLVPAGFLVTAWRFPRVALLTGSAFLITVLFNASYSNADIDRYYLGPALFSWLWLGVLGASVVDRLAGAAIERGWAVAALAGALMLAPAAIAYPATERAVDRSVDLSGPRWLDAVLSELPTDAVVVSWWSYSTPLWYAQYVEGRRADIAVIDDRTRIDENLGEVSDVIDRYLGTRPVYVIRVSLGELLPIMQRFRLEPLADPVAANVYRVLGRQGAS
jgi:hypothetical protein